MTGRRRVALAVAAIGAALLLSGCAPTVVLTPAPQATAVGCASVVVGLPDAVGAAQRRQTDAQGTAAWGTPAAVTLRCGVRTPQASSASCVTVDAVDWLLEDRAIDGETRRVLTTYGRDPGVQVVVTRAVSADDALRALSGPVHDGTRGTKRVCLADGTTPSPSPSS